MNLLLCLLLLGPLGVAQDEDKKELAALQGHWKAITVVRVNLSRK